MDMEAALHAIAQRIQALLECSSVTLSLASPPLRRHPLLDMFIADDESEQEIPLLTLDWVQDLIALALHTRFIQCNNNCDVLFYDIQARSVAVVPLERPMGCLGVLVCLDVQADKFLQGECLLLEQVKPTIAREIELLLSDAKMTFSLAVREPFVMAELSEQQMLVSLVGHDLRLPLTAIKGYASLLQAYGMPDAATSTPTDFPLELQRHYLSVIVEQTQHMEVLVNDLLDVTRIQRGQLALRNAWIDIVSLGEGVVQMLQDKVEQQEKGRYHIRYSPDVQSLLLWADPNRMQQVLMNLIENAIKYSPDGGLIEVVVRTHALSSSITVRDWGIGISHRQQSSLFHVFERGGRQFVRRDIAGLGLGLYIARMLVEAMNGSITLSSSEGQGTSVSFTLPRRYVAEVGLQETKNTYNVMLNPCEKISGLL